MTEHPNETQRSRRVTAPDGSEYTVPLKEAAGGVYTGRTPLLTSPGAWKWSAANPALSVLLPVQLVEYVLESLDFLIGGVGIVETALNNEDMPLVRAHLESMFEQAMDAREKLGE